jgi:hypothetical protein
MIDDRRPTALAIPSHGNSRMAYARPVAKPRASNRQLRLVRAEKRPAFKQPAIHRLRRVDLRLVATRPPAAAKISSAARVWGTVRRWFGLRPN